jgi:hypothetical protein
MTLKQSPLQNDFEPPEVRGHGVSVLFKPTQARYVFEVSNEFLMPGCVIDRQSSDLGGYVDLEVESYARQVAWAFVASLPE